MRLRFLMLPTLAVFLLAGCSQTAVVLWTDIPDIVPVVERFNATQDEHVVEVLFEANLGSALRLSETLPDLVVGTYIEDRATAALFSPLDRLLRRELDRDSFYADLLATGVSDARQHLLPVSFNLPLIYFRSEVPSVATSIIMSDSEIRTAGEAFNAQENDQWTQLAYSPVWNPSFLYQYLRLEGFIVRQSEAGTPAWPFEALVSGITSAREWLESQGGAGADRAFATKYLYDPQLQMVRSGRVAFGYGESNEYLNLSDARRDGLGFRWFGEDRTVHALERIVYAGIPNGARSQAGAEKFLVNLFSVDEQVAVVESSLRKRVDVFGVVGGFSSLWRMNEAHLGEYYPELQDAIPPARWIAFPPASPRHWGAIVDEVVEPWLVREVTRIPQSRDLEASVRAWLLQQED